MPSTQQYYDEFSDWYERERHHGYHALVDRLESEIACRYAAGVDALEAGCGTGLILRNVSRVARRATGIDLSRGMLGLATQKGLPVVQGSLAALPFADHSFDLVYSFKVLAHVDPIAPAVAELTRVVRPGGHVVLEFYNTHSLRHVIKRIRPPLAISARTGDDAVYTRYDSLQSIRSYLPSGMEVLETRGVRVFLPFPQLMRLPVIAPIVGAVETWAADAPFLRRFGGFLIVVARKP